MSELKAITNKLIYLNFGCEMIYILNNRVKSLEIEEDKRIFILKQIATALFSNSDFELVIKDAKSIITLEGFSNILHKVCHKSIITLDNHSYLKMIEMILMALKKDVLLMKNDFGIYSILLNHLEGVEKLIRTKEPVDPVRGWAFQISNSMKPFEFFMVKRDILNLLIYKHSKISVYLKNGFQANDSHIVIKPNDFAGFNIDPIGSVTEGANSAPSVPIEGLTPPATKIHPLASFREEKNDKLGYDLFDGVKAKDLIIVDKEYLSKVNEDLSSKIIGRGQALKRDEIIPLDLNFEPDEDATNTREAQQKEQPTNSSNLPSKDPSSQTDPLLASKQKAIDKMFKDEPIQEEIKGKDKDKNITGQGLLDMMDEED